MVEVESTAASLLLLNAGEVVRAGVGGLRSVGECEKERAGTGPGRWGGKGKEGVVGRRDDGGSDVAVWVSCIFARDRDDQLRLDERVRSENLCALLGGSSGSWGGSSGASSSSDETLHSIDNLLVVESWMGRGVFAERGTGGEWRCRDGGASRAWSSASWGGCCAGTRSSAGADGAGGRCALVSGAGHSDGHTAGGVLLGLCKDLVSALLARSLGWAGPEVVALINKEVAIAANDELVLRANALGALEALGGLGNNTSVSEGIVELALIGGVDAVCAVGVVAEDTVLADGVLFNDVRAQSRVGSSEGEAAVSGRRGGGAGHEGRSEADGDGGSDDDLHVCGLKVKLVKSGNYGANKECSI